MAPASATAIWNRPWSVRTVTLPPSVCVMKTLVPALSVTLSPAGMAVAGQSLERVWSWAMGESVQEQFEGQPGVEAARVVELRERLQLVRHLAHQHADRT